MISGAVTLIADMGEVVNDGWIQNLWANQQITSKEQAREQDQTPSNSKTWEQDQKQDLLARPKEAQFLLALYIGESRYVSPATFFNVIYCVL